MNARWVTGGGLALVAVLLATGLLLWRDRDVLSVRLPTRVLAPPAERPTTPQAALAYFQCDRCHGAAPMVENCVTCHQAILGGRFDRWEQAERVARWKGNLVHLVRTPDLSTLPGRVKRSWLVEFLQRPHVVRPLGGAMMPRLPIQPNEAELLADALGVTTKDEPFTVDLDRVTRGAALYEERQCASCHARGDAPADLRYGAPAILEANEARRRAPDLAWVSSRMTVSQLRAWLREPGRLQPGTLMPAVAPEEVEDLVAFLSSPAIGRPIDPPRAPRLLDRVVTADEVAQKLSRHLCFHCHSDSERPGDRGPGNSGGFGYRGAGIDLASARGLREAVQKLPKGRLVESLTARVREVQGQPVEGVLGMPLGFPPLPDEDIDLVFTWVEQGAR